MLLETRRPAVLSGGGTDLKFRIISVTGPDRLAAETAKGALLGMGRNQMRTAIMWETRTKREKMMSENVLKEGVQEGNQGLVGHSRI